jgi:hypothetical protein
VLASGKGRNPRRQGTSLASSTRLVPQSTDRTYCVCMESSRELDEKDSVSDDKRVGWSPACRPVNRERIKCSCPCRCDYCVDRSARDWSGCSCMQACEHLPADYTNSARVILRPAVCFHLSLAPLSFATLSGQAWHGSQVLRG